MSRFGRVLVVLSFACLLAPGARALLAAGADVHAVARNAFKVQPIHAAAASRNLDIVVAKEYIGPKTGK